MSEQEKFVPEEEIQKSETEKSTEDIEMQKEAMEKVKDITQEGTLLHGTQSEDLFQILKEGILSQRMIDRLGRGYSIEDKADNKEYYSTEGLYAYATTKKGKYLHPEDNRKNYIKTKDEFFEATKSRNEYQSIRESIIKSVKKLSECKKYQKKYILNNPLFVYYNRVGTFKNKKSGERIEYQPRDTFAASSYDTIITFKSPGKDREFPITSAEFNDIGGIIYNRLKPKYINGIIINDAYYENIKENLGANIILESINERLRKILDDIHTNNIKLNIPIYNIEGNLLWPKQMTNQEIKEMLAEKEKNKE